MESQLHISGRDDRRNAGNRQALEVTARLQEEGGLGTYILLLEGRPGKGCFGIL